MSKIIDEFNRLSQSKEKIYNSMQEEIAKTYLQTAIKKNKEKKVVPTSKMPLAIAVGASFLVLLIIMLNFSFNHNVFFLKGGVPNNSIIEKTSFLGDAKSLSKVTDNEAVLCNSRGYGWANYTLELKKPINLKRFNIKYTAKGSGGGEALVLVLMDADNRTYRIEKDPLLMLTKDWQNYAINLRAAKNAIDLRHISVIRFEFGSLTTGNHSSAAIFLKDIYITKAKRSKWL